jgi:hypothetical protein
VNAGKKASGDDRDPKVNTANPAHVESADHVANTATKASEDHAVLKVHADHVVNGGLPATPTVAPNVVSKTARGLAVVGSQCRLCDMLSCSYSLRGAGLS